MTMKVCFLAGTLGIGGAERQLLYMLRALQNDDIEVRVLSLTKNEHYERKIRGCGIEVEWVGNSTNKFVRLGKIIYNLKRRPPDILQSAHFYTNIYTAAAGRILNIKNIGAIRNDLHSEIVSNGFYGKWLLSLPHHLIANSELALKRAIDKGITERKIDFVRNAVETVPKSEERKPAVSEIITVLFVGRLVKEKRPELFIETASHLCRKFSQTDLRFEIIGEGSLRPELELLANNLNLPKGKFSFLGAQSEMSKIYRRADVLMLTSEHEGTPNVVLEAMAHGLAVIATDVGGVSEVLTDERGMLVNASDKNALIEAAVKLISNRSLRADLGSRAKKYVEANHSIESLKKQLTTIYCKLLENDKC